MHTWPSGIQRLFALRDFRITDRNKRTIGVAVTGWLAIDAHTRRPVRVEPFLEKIHRAGSERALMNTLEKLPAIEQYECEQRFSVRNRDIDLNQHVNSVSYIEWVIESIPPTLQNTSILTELEINFLGEAHLGDNIISRFQPQNKDRTVFLHGIASEGDNQDLARASTVWEKV